MKTLLTLCIALLLTACGSLVSADQLNAAASSKNRMAALCVQGNPSALGGISKLVFASVDAEVVKAGQVSVDDSCKMSFTNTNPVTPAVVPAAPGK